MQQCRRCLEFKSEDEFHYRDKSKGIRRYDCKVCVKDDHKQRYQNNPERKASLNQRTKASRKEIASKIWEYKSTHPCVDCGRDNPAGLEFDHLPEFQKEFNICQAPERGFSWEKVLKEIAKCEVVCGYCHGIRTHDRRNAVLVYWLCPTLPR